jgi:hypothetical protein
MKFFLIISMEFSTFGYLVMLNPIKIIVLFTKFTAHLSFQREIYLSLHFGYLFI